MQSSFLSDMPNTDLKDQLQQYEQSFQEMRRELLHTKYLYNESQDVHQTKIQKLETEVNFLRQMVYNSQV